ncbi:hypothetical protein A9Z06_06900 [Rhizobium sp. YK2]|nr:hypothetical protein A9Z06_06900 [Rhizobium sp. YK2]
MVGPLEQARQLKYAGIPNLLYQLLAAISRRRFSIDRRQLQQPRLCEPALQVTCAPAPGAGGF